MDSSAITSYQELVQAWLRHARDSGCEDSWAFNKVNETVWTDARKGWDLVLALVAAAPDELLGDVGVGPLEDLIDQHADLVIDKVVKQAASDPRFREALCNSWFIHGALPPHAERKLVEATGGEIRIKGVTA
jgi:hypothetical protein